MKKTSKIILIISGLAFVAANASVGTTNHTARSSATAQNTALIFDDGKTYPMTRSMSGKGLEMLLPNALEKAAADAIKRRASQAGTRLKSAIDAQENVIRLR
ncbi:MAG TPA: hypothetical protein ENH05_07905 [Rhizobiales bacterium]|nr:hypothetical protein [Hyphomicrobiales bacterium]